MKRLLLIPLAMCLAACADNAVFELRLDLPRAPDPMVTTYAYVQSRSADTITFDGDWAGADASEGFALTSAVSTQHVSFVTSGPAMTRPLGIRVRFCEDRVCGAIADTHAVEVQYRIERAFYRGQRTRFPIIIPTVPAATAMTATDVDKCQVEGCTMGSATSFCFLDGRHFCE